MDARHDESNAQPSLCWPCSAKSRLDCSEAAVAAGAASVFVGVSRALLGETPNPAEAPPAAAAETPAITSAGPPDGTECLGLQLSGAIEQCNNNTSGKRNLALMEKLKKAILQSLLLLVINIYWSEIAWISKVFQVDSREFLAPEPQNRQQMRFKALNRTINHISIAILASLGRK